MRIRPLFQQQAILIGISILSGLFVLSGEFRLKATELGMASICLLLFQTLFFIFFTWLLLQINIRWCPRKRRFLKQLVCSLILSVVFCGIVRQYVGPLINRANRRVGAQYEQTPPDFNRKRDVIFHAPKRSWYNQLFTLSIVVFTLSRIYLLYEQKKEAERNLEKLQNESLQSRLDALHNQINPHFFFNALNSLHALIAEGQNGKSLSYLSNLSNVFRYILQSEKRGLVSLQEELNFLSTYHFMLYVKYEERLRFDMDIAPEYASYQLPVLSLLPLVENVIKHNEISTRNPLELSIRSTDEPALVIQNRKQPKLDEVEKVGIGLKNLNNRFLLLLHKEIRIENTTESFCVTLPLQPPNSLFTL